MVRCLTLTLLLLSLVTGAASAEDVPINVPPYPGPAPQSYQSAAAYEHYVTWRIATLRERELAIYELGRGPDYESRRRIANALMYTGGGVILGGSVLVSAMTDESGSTYRYGTPAVAAAGLALVVTGFALRLSLRHNANRDEVNALNQERQHWERELKRVRVERGWLGRVQDVQLRFALSGLGLSGRF